MLNMRLVDSRSIKCAARIVDYLFKSFLSFVNTNILSDRIFLMSIKLYVYF